MPQSVAPYKRYRNQANVQNRMFVSKVALFAVITLTPLVQGGPYAVCRNLLSAVSGIVIPGIAAGLHQRLVVI